MAWSDAHADYKGYTAPTICLNKIQNYKNNDYPLMNNVLIFFILHLYIPSIKGTTSKYENTTM